MIHDLKSNGNNLIGQQILLRRFDSLPYSWKALKLTLMHDEIIKSFDDILHHLELEVESRGTNKNATLVVRSDNVILRNESVKDNRRANWQQNEGQCSK